MSLISEQLRQVVTQRAGHRCEYCHLAQEFQVATFPADHVTPKALEGPTLADNLALACPRCNALKWTRTECHDFETGTTVPIFDPRSKTWSEHFRWSPTEPILLEGLTRTGRGTIVLLDLNGAPHLAIRRLLMIIGSHPPR